MSQTVNPKETTKETTAERQKREKDGLDVWADIVRYETAGFAAVDADDMDRFKWYGLYTQRPAEEGFFMLRAKVPNGALTSVQLDTLGRLSQEFGRDTGDITTRQGIQVHYIRIEDGRNIINQLGAVGLTTQGACGDIVRNVVGCPLAGIDADELFDAEPLAQRIKDRFLNDKAFSNLPRKFKISVTGCRHACAQHEINDIGFVAIKNHDGELGFDLWVAGGLGARPMLAKRLGAFVTEAEAVEVATTIVGIFRDHGYRSDRRKARLKFLMADWGPVKFREELESRLGRKLTDSFPIDSATHAEFQASPTNESIRDHTGVTPQRQPGLNAVGVATLRGRFSGTQMRKVAALAQTFGQGRVRLTNAQNFLILDVPTANVAELVAELAANDLHVHASEFRRGTISCTGRQFCKLAHVETKARAEEVIRHLETTIPDFNDHLRVSVTGCTNACAQYQVAEIGLVGVKGQVNGEETEFFQIQLGGHLGRDAALGRKLNKRVPVADAKTYLENIINVYRAQHAPGERFYEFVGRYDVKQLESLDQWNSLQPNALAQGVAQ